jgi:hypothetical protein
MNTITGRVIPEDALVFTCTQRQTVRACVRGLHACVRACIASEGVQRWRTGKENVEKETVFAELAGAKRRPRLAGLRNDTWPRQDSVAMATRKCAAATCGPTAATLNASHA